MPISKEIQIVSGGQTGVDRAALDVAMNLGLETGGWCPKGRLAEDGEIDNKYKLKEVPEPSYQMRTEWNVRDSDATFIIAHGKLTEGTAFTLEVCKQLNKPFLVLDPINNANKQSELFEQWLIAHEITVLNVAGPRQDPNETVYGLAYRFLITLLK